MGIIVAGAAVVFGMPAASSAWLRHAGQEKTAGQCPATLGEAHTQNQVGPRVRRGADEDPSVRGPSAALPPRNPRVSALRVLPEGLFSFETHTRAAAQAPAAGDRPAAGLVHERGCFSPVTTQGTPTCAALRLVVPRAFRLVRVV